MPTLVLLHGWGADGRIWTRQRQALAARANLLTPDWPRFDADWLREYLKPLDIARTVIAGWSLGGMLALEALAPATVFPRALVLISLGVSFCSRDDYPPGTPAAVVRAMRRRLGRDPEAVVEEFFSLMLAPGEEAYRHELAAWMPAPRVAQLQAGLDYLLARDLRPQVAQLAACRVIIMHGEVDRIAPVAQAHDLAARLPAARAEILAGTGHAPMLTRAATVNRILSECLDGN